MERNSRMTINGLVVSDARDKTITVEINQTQKHPIYGKRINKTVKFHAHDEENDAKIGDRVKIMETKPISKTKYWRLVEVLERAE